jgi:hypothetical protein
MALIVTGCYWLGVDIGVDRRRVVERPCIGNRCLNTLIYWRLMLDKMESGWGHLRGSVEHLKGKGGESVVAILIFLCSSPRLCQLRTEGLVPMSKY